MAKSTYQLVPYLLSVHVAGKPTETRPIDNLDGKGRTLQDAVLRIFDGLRGRGELVDPGNPDRKLRLVRLSNGDSCVLVELKPGRSGIASDIEQAHDGNGAPPAPIRRTRRDTEYIPVRHAFYFPAGSHHAILLAERAGVSGAITFLSELLRKTFRGYFGDLILEVNPAVTGEVMRSLTTGRPVKSLVFTRPTPQDTTGKTMFVAGESYELEVRLKTPRRRSWGWDTLPKRDNEVSRESLLGALSVALGGGGTDDEIRELLDHEWSAATEVKLASGTTRTVDVASSRAVTMTFPIEEQSATDDRPTEADFVSACEATLEVAAGQYGMTPDRIKRYAWSDQNWELPDGQQRWKVIWDEPGTS